MLSLMLFILIGCGEKEESKDTATAVEASEQN
jgi:uncharacterized lipoprotein YehR (DUF1307 family)